MGSSLTKRAQQRYVQRTYPPTALLYGVLHDVELVEGGMHGGPRAAAAVGRPAAPSTCT